MACNQLHQLLGEPLPERMCFINLNICICQPDVYEGSGIKSDKSKSLPSFCWVTVLTDESALLAIDSQCKWGVLVKDCAPVEQELHK